MINQLLHAQDLAEARAKLYQLLATIYAAPPTPDFLKLLAEWATILRATDTTAQPLSQQIRQGLAIMDDFFKRPREESWDELVETLSVEFTRLFRGVKPNYSPLPPYESVYRENPGRVFGELSIEVKRLYHHFGLDLASEFHGEPPDHLSFELEFMHLLCNREAEAWERDNEDEALRLVQVEEDFLKEHLLTWLARFCDKIREYDRLGLFRGLADLTEGWVNFDYQQFLHTESSQMDIPNK